MFIFLYTIFSIVAVILLVIALVKATSQPKKPFVTKAYVLHFCYICRAVVNEQDQFCYNCGIHLKSTFFCPCCGEESEKEALFCRRCGFKLV